MPGQRGSGAGLSGQLDSDLLACLAIRTVTEMRVRCPKLWSAVQLQLCRKCLLHMDC